MLMVVLSHYFEWGESAITNKGLVAFMSALGDPGVGIFFALSGYALYKGYGDGMKGKGLKYIVSRFKGVYLPYLIIVGAINLFDGTFTDIKSIVRYLTGADYWFMEVIFIIYIAFFVIGYLPKWRLFILTVFIIDLSLLLYIKDYAVFWYDANWCFALGMLLSKYESKWSVVNKGFSINIKDYVFCLIGQISLYIYILHTFLYRKIMTIMLEKGMEVSWYIRALGVFALTCIVAYLIYSILNLIYKLADRKNSKA